MARKGLASCSTKNMNFLIFYLFRPKRALTVSCFFFWHFIHCASKESRLCKQEINISFQISVIRKNVRENHKVKIKSGFKMDREMVNPNRMWDTKILSPKSMNINWISLGLSKNVKRSLGTWERQPENVRKIFSDGMVHQRVFPDLQSKCLAKSHQLCF